jgi:hypothetical protein
VNRFHKKASRNITAFLASETWGWGFYLLSKRGRYTVIQNNLHVKEVIVGDGERRKRYSLCYKPQGS